MLRFFIYLLLFIVSASGAAWACDTAQRPCLLELLQDTAKNIQETSWRDQTYRELAKSLAHDGRYDRALDVVDQINTPDTQALTIRGIGMAVAENTVSEAEYDRIFAQLRAKAEAITHPPSYAIALTYIAMAQAFAGDNEGAWATASDMKNDALRHKAYGETAEIQAEKGDYAAAMQSIEAIESDAYKNKAYSITSKLFADAGHFDKALGAAKQVSNPYKKASALQYILDKQVARAQEAAE